MQTHKTLEDARAAAKTMSDIRYIIEIDHATEGRCYIKVKAPMKSLKIALEAKPMPEIRQLIAEYSVLTETEMAAERIQALRDHTNCERCGKKIDGNTAYSQQEWYANTWVTAFYCEPCRSLMTRIGEGEYTELQERAAARHSHEPYTKEDL